MRQNPYTVIGMRPVKNEGIEGEIPLLGIPQQKCEIFFINMEKHTLKKMGVVPTLAIVRFGSRPDDLAYERGAIKRCQMVGIKTKVFEFPEELTQSELISEVKKMNEDSQIHGILLFRPLPKHIDENVIKYVISPDKDVDCLNPVNVAKVFEGDETGLTPCTPEAVMETLEHYGISESIDRAIWLYMYLIDYLLMKRYL